MNQGLLGWPQAKMAPLLADRMFGWPPSARDYRPRPVLDERSIVATQSNNVTFTNCIVGLPPGLQVGDYCVLMFKCLANNVPGTPAGWTVLQSGTQGNTGNITLIRLCDGSEGDTVTITSASATTFMALTARISNSGVYAASAPSSASGATPTLFTVSVPGVGGQVPCLAVGVATALFAASLGNFPTSGIFQTNKGLGSSSGTTWENLAQSNDSSRSCFIVWADIVGPTIIQYNAVGTWTNFTFVHLLFPYGKAPVAGRAL